MTLYIQHGYGRADRIQVALNEGAADGVILSPRHERPERLTSFIEELRNDHDTEVFFDPQLHIAALPAGKVGYLEQYGYFPGLMAGNQFSLRKIQQIVRDVIDFQQRLGLTAILSPTVIAEGFDDRWHQTAVNFADASLDYHAGLKNVPPLVLSFAVNEGGLGSRSGVDRFLDTLTQPDWNAGGVYLLTPRTNSDYEQGWHSERMANLLYTVHVLGELNGLQVIMGYQDFCGLPFRAAGATAFATGWSQSDRQFRLRNFLEQERGGGQPPKPRYSSGPLLNSIFIEELQSIFELGQLDAVLSRVAHDGVITDAPSPADSVGWTANVAQRHHWHTLRQLDANISAGAHVAVPRLMRRIREAIGLYRQLQQPGVVFSRTTGPDHLDAWAVALSDFARRAGFAS